MFKFERDLRKQVEQHYQQLRETQQNLHLSPENVHSAVNVALEIAGQPPLIPAKLSSNGKAGISSLAGKAFDLPLFRGSWMVCRQGLEHPHTREIRPIVFDHELAKGRDDVVLAHLNHRLVQMSLRLLRAEVWSPQERKGLHRVTARLVPNIALDNPAVVAHARLVLVGGEGVRLHEELISSGGEIVQGRLRRFNVGQVQSALDAATDRPASGKTQEQLKSVWDNLEPALVQSLEARMKDRLDGMRRQLKDREEKEVSDIRAVMGELETMIRRELGQPEYQQLDLFTSSEREQYNRNVQALRLRLAQIPEELEKEIAAIRQRFADPQPRMFPVAVTFLVPEKYS